MELIPDRAGYAPGDVVTLELAEPASSGARVIVTHLFDIVADLPVPVGARTVRLPELPNGGYGVRYLDAAGAESRTAFDVRDDPFELPRYGFVAKLDRTVEVESDLRLFRRLHLNLAQFYDWGYRHSELLPPEPEYLDPLGQPRDLAVVDELASAFDAAGVVPLGYSAVYAIGNDETDAWGDELLLRADGAPYRLGEDFLTLVDPAAPRWLAHYGAMLARALAGTELRGFHLDQYGWPKRALRGDGALVDLDRSFSAMIEAVHAAVPGARLVFNNVNDFGTVQTAGASQDASYIEVWPPHSTLADLGALATRTRALRPGHPPILSAYLSCYEREPAERADAAARLVMATAFSHGATHLLLGEDGHVLTDPYYPRNHALAESGVAMFASWYDLLVRWGELLADPAQLDVTEFTTGGVNTDIVFESAAGTRFSTKAEAGTVWTRVVRTPVGRLIHLINLVAQSDTEWDAGKAPVIEQVGITLRLAPVDGRETLRWVEPGADPVLLVPGGAAEAIATDSLSASQTTLGFELPPLRDWAFLFLPEPGGREDSRGGDDVR